MKKLYFSFIAALCLFFTAAFNVSATGWPANYQGVMLQGFYWDSNNETSWTNLTNQSDELSKYFSLIWVPNSAQSSGYPAMGYMPIYWFTHHNSSFGTEAQLKNMISTFKAKGVGIIEDLVINHRVGVSNWYDFPSETWNGKTYHLTNGAICSSDEMWRDGGHGCPYSRGNNDTGEDFNGARDLDHTNTTVQAHIKDYCKFLIDDMEYAGFRIDMVKGYSAQYTKMYNQYSKPKFSVGEYYDFNYDPVAKWIEDTGRESAAFDFPFKACVNDAFYNHDMTKLVWKANGTTDQPAGLIHYGYPQYAVTFIENHDTARDDYSSFKGNVVAANAFMLCSPGTPCVFWPHYTKYKSEIQKIIAVRNAVGVHNMSAVKVLRVSTNCYMAEVTGTKGKLVVKIGSDMVSPDGYTDSQIKASGTDYCIWSTTDGGVVTDPDKPEKPFNVYYDNSISNWTTPHVHYWGDSETEWPGVAMTKHQGNIWVYTVPAGTTGLVFNSGGSNPAQTDDFTAIADHVYNIRGDQGVYDGGNGGGGESPFKVYFDNANTNWTSPHLHYWGLSETEWPGVAMTKHEGNVWVYTVPAGTTGLVFNSGGANPDQTDDFTAVPNHIYDKQGDQGVYDGGNGGGGDDPVIPGTYPETLYLIGTVNGKNWSTSSPEPAGHTKGEYTWTNVSFDDSGDGHSYFSFVTKTGSSWDEVNQGDRYGSEAFNTGAENHLIEAEKEYTIVLNQANVSAMGATAWKLAAGKYNLVANLATMKMTVTSKASIDDITADNNEPVEFYNLQGIKVTHPANGIYIRRQGNTVTKVFVR